MRKNFRVENLTDIIFDGKIYDLHNDFDFHDFRISLIDSSINILWIGINRDKEKYFVISSSGVDYFSMRIGCDSADRNVTKVVGFLSEEFRSDFDSFDYDQGEENRDLVVMFENDTSIKISCKEAIASLIST